jgi:pullulanase/glycogen debranching enzyme
MGFTHACNKFRNAHSSLRRATFFSGQPDEASGLTFAGSAMKDVTWLAPSGQPMADHDMQQAGGFAMMLSGDPGNSSPKEKSFTRRVQRSERDSPLLVMVNQTMQPITFTLPDVPGVSWKPALKSNPQDRHSEPVQAGQQITLGFHSMIAFEGSRLLEKGTVAEKVTAARSNASAIHH